MKRVIAAAIIASAAAKAGATELQPLSGDLLRDTVAGKTVLLHTRVGDIPITYRANGTMIGRAGDLVAYTGQERDRGRWWVQDDKLCQQWETWLEGRAYCATIRQDGPTVHWVRNDGQRGKATIVQPAVAQPTVSSVSPVR